MSAAKDIREIADVVKEAADFLGTIAEQLPRQPLADELGGCAHWLRETASGLEKPIDMVLHCPACLEQHIDAPEWINAGPDERGRRTPSAYTWTNPPHRTHLCHSCGHKWRPADVATNGVVAIKTKGKDDSPIVQPKRRMPALGIVYPPLQGATAAGMVELAKRESMLDAHGAQDAL